MARWFYNRPSEKCDETEIKVANKLRRLSKRWTIRWGFYYADNKGTRREGDFLIFDPIHGLLVLEVKGDRLRQFAPTGRWEGDPEKDRDHPLFQLDQEHAGILKTLSETEQGWRPSNPAPQSEENQKVIRHLSINRARGLDAPAVIMIGTEAFQKISKVDNQYTCFMGASRAKQLPGGGARVISETKQTWDCHWVTRWCNFPSMPTKKTTPKKKSASPSRNSRSGDTRRPIERIFTIHQAIQRGRFPNCRQLAEQIEVTQKTIQRDITFMQNSLGLPLVYDGGKHGYFYERPVHEFPMMRYSVEDVVALFLARKAVEPLQGSPLEATLRDSFKRLSGALQGEITFRWSDLDEAFSVKDSGVVPADIRLFEKVSRAVLECRELRFEYRKIDGDLWEPRQLRPFHLAEFDGGWYVIGHDIERKARRTFALQRMKSLKVMKANFLRPADFNRTEHLGGSFGVWHTPGEKGKRHRIRLRFTGWAARMVSERRWHPSQETRWVGKGEEALEMILDLSSFEEISRWILSWGPQVEVVEPEELRVMITEATEAVRSLYHQIGK